jgi:hypothetical protein
MIYKLIDSSQSIIRKPSLLGNNQNLPFWFHITKSTIITQILLIPWLALVYKILILIFCVVSKKFPEITYPNLLNKKKPLIKANTSLH